MKQGFIYRFDLCVSCQACVAGCYLENNGNVPWRMILSNNPEGNPGLPVHNLSLACNHCEDPVCLEGCPTYAYKMDKETGAVILDAKRCIGCNYCYWNCPFDAPHYNSQSKEVEKCNFCYERLDEGLEPACTSACPTGALKYGSVEDSDRAYDNVPAMGLKPRLDLIMPRAKNVIPEIIPVTIADNAKKLENIKNAKVSPAREWSLITFSFLSSLLVAFAFSEWKGTINPGFWGYFLILLIAFLASLTHLGKPLASWRSLSNIKNSPISLEVGAFILFSILSLPAMFLGNRILWIPSFITGLILLVFIDNVYTFSDTRTRITYHAGQSFLTGLLFSSFLINEEMAFLFIIIIKIISAIYFKILKSDSTIDRIFSTAYTLISIIICCWMFISKNISPYLFGLLLLNELSMRIMFYRDLEPISIMEKYKEL